jgi:hypothetical protein
MRKALTAETAHQTHKDIALLDIIVNTSAYVWYY